MDKLQTNFNFGGFYNSTHDWVIDNYLDSFIRDRETDELPENEGEIYDVINYKGLRNLYCTELIKFMNSELNINLECVELDSPAYYNFTTDKIVVKFDENDFINLRIYVNSCVAEPIDTLIEELLKDWTTQRDGYIPFYSYSEIKDNLEWQMEAVLQLFAQECLNCEDDFWYKWYDLIDDLLGQLGADYGVGSIEPVYSNEGEEVEELEENNQTEPEKVDIFADDTFAINLNAIESIAKQNNHIHYLKWKITDNLSVRYFYSFDTKLEMVGKFGLKNHKHKQLTEISEETAKEMICSFSTEKFEEIIGFNVKGFGFKKYVKKFGEDFVTLKNDKEVK